MVIVMSKTSLSIRMLRVLYSRNIVSVSELADMLETNPRNIPEYKKELEAAGYCIESIPGKYGGYSLIKSSLFPVIRLTENEKEGLIAGYNYLRARNDFMRISDYADAMAKVSAATLKGDLNQEEISVIPRFPPAMPQEELQKRYTTISECITDKQVLRIDYRSNDNIIRQRSIHPYKLYMYNNGWFVLAFCEMANTMRYFKLNRIISYQKENRKFRRLYSYNEREWLDAYGMKRNGEWYDVKLKFTGKHAMFTQDYCYGKDQVIECVDQNTTIFSLKMQYKDNIVGFVLSHCGYCEVLEPQWLKDEVKGACEKILQIYKEEM